jgi:hypothetical protein
MGSLNWKVGGINRDQVENEITTLRANSPTFNKMKQMALDIPEIRQSMIGDVACEH